MSPVLASGDGDNPYSNDRLKPAQSVGDSLKKSELSIENYLEAEEGTVWKEAPHRIALVYPSPYRAAMSSLGFQAIYKLWNEIPNFAADRAFLPDDTESFRKTNTQLKTVERNTPLSHYSCVAFSISYELELAGLIDCLEFSSIPALSKDREEKHPLVVAGGPLTFSNPAPLFYFCDVIAMGEGEELATFIANTLMNEDATKAELLKLFANTPGFYVPSIHGDAVPPVAKVDIKYLPAQSQIISPHTELRSMFLTEAVRGCSRGCTYCVMRRSTNGGMRKVDPQIIIDGIPEHAKKVGLVGASVTDHPAIADIIREIVHEKKCAIGISSLRADRLNQEIVGLLADGGYRTLTVAFDAASKRLRETIERKTNSEHILMAAELANANRLRTLKLYMMVGLPGETEEDLEELVTFLPQVKKIHSNIALGIAPFVAKRNTPMDGDSFAGIKVVDKRLAFLRKRLARVATVRPTSARWAWVEYMLAQGQKESGLAVFSAHKNGGTFAAYKKAFKEHAIEPTGPVSRILSGNEKIRLHKKRMSVLKNKKALPVAS